MGDNPWRQLWADDPLLAGPDPLDLHNLDYSLADLDEAILSAWRIGFGGPSVTDDDEPALDAKEEDAQLPEEEA